MLNHLSGSFVAFSRFPPLSICPDKISGKQNYIDEHPYCKKTDRRATVPRRLRRSGLTGAGSQRVAGGIGFSDTHVNLSASKWLSQLRFKVCIDLISGCT